MSQSRCHARGFEYISALVSAKFCEWPPSIAYDASVNGAPPNPISGTLCGPSSSSPNHANRFEHVRERLARLEALQPIDVGFGAQRIFNRRSFAADEVERDAHRLERQQQIGKQNRRVDVDAADRLQRDDRRQLGRSADVEQGVPAANLAIFGHVAPGLPHEPHRCAIDRLAPAGFQETVVH